MRFEKKIKSFQNSNNDSFGIHSVKVLVQVHYLDYLVCDYKRFSENIPNIDILLTFHNFQKCDEKTHISGGWRPT